jgi:hypothetical protein
MRFLERWWSGMLQIHANMRAREQKLDPFSAAFIPMTIRTTTVQFFAPFPPVARLLERKLFG